jgi:hypothetical protein
VPTLVTAGERFDIRASLSDGRNLLSGVKLRTRVFAPRASVDDYVRKYRSEISRIKIPRTSPDGKLDAARLDLARLVILRDRMKQKSGEDILARAVYNLALSEVMLKRNGVRGLESALSPIERGTVALGGGGTAPGEVSSVVRVGAAGSVAHGSAFDPRLVQRPRQAGRLSGRFGLTKVPGSYSVQITATGFSPSCNSRFVRHDLLSVAVAERR